MNPNTLPLAPAVLIEGNQGNYWRVTRCPLCGATDRSRARHLHGAGAKHENPYRYLSPRIAHCLTTSRHGSYLLIVDESRIAVSSGECPPAEVNIG